ncbi:complex I NDUFA9 subunit family protein [Ectothiorhodospiraceae bacterium WFHF3C12]|nr:complex I NDUFA9 subunit family protein [Ectothiorhodospiraceae bacterium WFHF3C12]
MAGGLVTVFGGTGFLGSRIVRQLVRRGHRVRVAARRPEDASTMGGSGCVERQTADIRAAHQVREALKGADAAVNAVSLYVERRHVRFRDIHVDAARNLALAAQSAGLGTLVHVSGIGADPQSHSPYVAARGDGETAVLEAMPTAVLLRPSVLYGADGGFLHALDAVTRLPLIPLFGDGTTRLQPVHADDAAAACAHAVEKPEAGTVYELGGPEILTYRDIVAMVLRHRGRRRPVIPVSFALWRALATAASVMPNPPVTRDQVILMEHDNVVAAGVPSFRELGIGPVPLSGALRECLR